VRRENDMEGVWICSREILRNQGALLIWRVAQIGEGFIKPAFLHDLLLVPPDRVCVSTVGTCEVLNLIILPFIRPSQGRNKVRWRPGQEASLVPHVRT